MKRRAVLFDLDGTLLDTIEDLAYSMNAVLSAAGFPRHPVDSYRYFVGDGVETLAVRALPEAARGNAVLVAQCVEAMRLEYGKHWDRATRPYPGVPELLAGLSGAGVGMAVLSNKPHEFVSDMLDRYFPGIRFDAVMGKRPEFPKKPDPGSALEICRIMGIPPGGFLYLGDTDTDMLTALSAGMYPVGALWGFRTGKELLESGARRVISNPLEIIPLLEA